MSANNGKHPEERETILRNFAERLARAELQVDKLVNAAVESCRDLLQAKQCSVWLVDQEQEKLVLRAARGYKALKGKLEDLVYPLKRPKREALGITAWIFINRSPVTADTYSELKKHPGHRGEYDKQLHGRKPAPKDQDRKHPCQQFYGAPIYLGAERFGVLKVENKKVPDKSGQFRFSEAEKAALDTVAAMLAMALKHAAAREQENELAEMRTRQEMAAIAVHNLNNPAIGVRNALEYISDTLRAGKFEKSKISDVVSAALLQVNTIKMTREAFMAFIRPDYYEETLSVEPVEFSGFAKHIFNTVHSANPRAKLNLKRVPKEKLLYLPSAQLEIALTALMENSLEATKDKPNPTITLSLQQSLPKYSANTNRRLTGKLRICIEDNGNGIAEIMQDRLFQPFSTTKALGGGLGLYASRKLLRAIGGEVRYVAEHTRGTLFEILTPVGKGPI